MAQFDVCRIRGSNRLVVDCQSDTIGVFDTRFVAPLVPPGAITRSVHRLLPVFRVDGVDLVMATHLAGAVPRQELEPATASLAEDALRIQAAIDMLITGI
jgi:toxin CcdB